jgi:hypothetical protein
MHRFRNKKGIALIFVFIVMAALSGIALAFLFMVRGEIGSSGAGLRNAQAFYIAEAGRAEARRALATGGDISWSETDEPFGEGTYTVIIVQNEEAGTYTIISEGYVPDSTNPLAQREVTESGITIESNLSLGADASSSLPVQGQNVAGEANDNDTDSKWKSRINNGSWLKLDFGSSTTFDKVVIKGAANISPGTITIEYSADNVAYHEVANISELPLWTFTFDSVSAQCLKISMNGNRPEITELETYDIAEGSVILGQGEFATAW